MYSGILLSLFVVVVHGDVAKIEVTAPTGTIVGYEYEPPLQGDTGGIQFLGIPYAEPPLGDLRFAKPVKKPSFSETFNASSYGNSCMQYLGLYHPEVTNVITMNEDCLTLNIFTPMDAINGTKKAVMFFIHGGWFVSGSSIVSGGENLAVRGDVIVVTINYRLGPFGFMDIGSDNAPGNIGLWDQQLALKWVNENIESFGGDNSKVTIHGQSSGAASVAYHMTHKNNAGLFQRAIAQSGSPVSWWASTTTKESRKLALDLAGAVGCVSSDLSKRLDCMRNVDAVKLNDAALAFLKDRRGKFAPVMKDSFITFDPRKCASPTSACADRILPVEYMSGINDFDGLVVFKRFNTTWQTDGLSDEVFQTQMLPFVLDSITKSLPGKKKVYEALIKYQYSNHRDSSDVARLHEVSKLFTDIYFTIPGITFNDVVRGRERKTYLYKYSHKPIKSRSGPLVSGANNGDELGYVFGSRRNRMAALNLTRSMIPESEISFSEAVIEYWSNFAKSGNPNTPGTEYTTQEWPEYNGTTKAYMEFGRTTAQIKSSSHMYAERMDFWMKLLTTISREIGQNECSASGANFNVAGDVVLCVLVLFASSLIKLRCG